MRVRMLKTASGSPNGFDPPARHDKGRVYDLPQGLAEIYLGQGWARPETAPGAVSLAAPENKAHGRAARGTRRAVHLGFGRWAVVDEEGKRLNEKWLSKADALALAEAI